MSLLVKFQESLKKSELVVESHDLTIEFCKQAPPTKTGLARKLVKFKELPSSVFCLAAVISGNLVSGKVYKVELSQSGDYINVVGIQGDRTEAMDKLDYAQSIGLSIHI